GAEKRGGWRKRGARQSRGGFDPPHSAIRYGTPAESHTVRAGGWHASGLALLEASPVRLLMAQCSLHETLRWGNIQRLTRAPHCAHVVWPDLEYATVWRYDAVGKRRRQEGQHGHDHTTDSSRSTLPSGLGRLTAAGGSPRD